MKHQLADLIKEDMQFVDSISNIELVEVRSDYREGSFDAAVAEIDQFVTDFGIDAERWQASFLGGLVNAGFHKEYLRPQRVLRSRIAGVTVGHFLVHGSWDRLPFEQNEDGQSSCEVSLLTADEHVLTIEARGNLSVDWPDVDDEEGGSEYVWQIDSHAKVAKITP